MQSKLQWRGTVCLSHRDAAQIPPSNLQGKSGLRSCVKRHIETGTPKVITETNYTESQASPYKFENEFVHFWFCSPQ